MALIIHHHHYHAWPARTRDARPSPEAQIEDLANRMAAALEELMGWARTGDAFRESDHPRAPDGRFGNRAGEHVNADLGPKPTTAKAKSAKAAIHELLSSGHGFTKEELMSAAGIKTEKLFSDYIAMLKNPKYAGPAGALTITRSADGKFSVGPNAGTVPAPTPVPTAAPAPAPTPRPTPAPTPVPAALSGYAAVFHRFTTAQDAAVKATKAAKTKQDHQAAALLHRQTAQYAIEATDAGPPANEASTMRYYAQYHMNRGRDHDRIAETLGHQEDARAMLPSDHAETTKKIEARFLKTQVEDIHREMRDRFGLGVRRGDLPLMVRSAKAVDITKPGAAATNQRKMLGHVHAALEDLERRGYDIKAALESATKPVQYSPANIGASMGLAWQGGYDSSAASFAVNGNKRLGSNEEQFASNTKRMTAGQPRWTISSSALGNEATRSTIVHELAHALGMQRGVDSPSKLSDIITEHMKSVAPDPGDKLEYGREHRTRTAWIKKNISEYAAANIREADAELAAMVTSPKYVRGTLPQAFEDHVDRLFKKRSPQ